MATAITDEQTIEALLKQAEALDARAQAMHEAARSSARLAASLRAEVAALQTEAPEIRDGHRWASRDERLRRRLLDCLQELGPLPTSAIAKRLKLPTQRARAGLAVLESETKVKRGGIGAGTVWALADADEVAEIHPNATAYTLIRDAARRLDTFTFAEISAALPAVSEQSLRLRLPQLEREGLLSSERIGTTKLYAYERPDRSYTPARERQTPPELKVVELHRKTSPVAGTGRTAKPGNRDVADLLEKVTAAGGQIEKRARHWAVLVDDAIVATVPSTPSDWRSLLNARASIRRAGLDID